MKSWMFASLALAVLCLAAQPAAAQDSPADPAFEAAKQAFESMPLENRVLVQRSLAWAVPFNGAALGTFGKLTYNGILAFEKKAKLEADGMLTSEELDTLVEEAEAAQKAVKWSIQTDKKSGVTIGLPMQLLTKRADTGTGSKWTNADASIAVETAKGGGTAADLPAAFERFVALPDRKVTYKLLRPDFFVLTGTRGEDSFYIRYAGNDTAVRGFTFRYPTAKQKLMERYVIAAANSFDPFPGQPGGGVIDAPKEPPKPVIRRGTAALLADGGIITASDAVAGCKALRISGQAAKPEGAEGALTRFSGAAGASTLAARQNPPQIGERVFVVSATGGAVTLAPGAIVAAGNGLAVSAAVPADGMGALVVDRTGLLLGMVTGDPAAVKPIAGTTPVSRLAITPVPGTDTGGGAPKSAGIIAEALAGAAAPLECDL